MIRQQELRQVLDVRAEQANLLEQDASVRLYVLAAKREKELVSALRERVSRGEPVASGRLALEVKRSAVVSWERFVQCLTSVPAVAAVLGADKRAQTITRQMSDREGAAPFIGERVSVDVVMRK